MHTSLYIFTHKTTHADIHTVDHSSSNQLIKMMYFEPVFHAADVYYRSVKLCVEMYFSINTQIMGQNLVAKHIYTLLPHLLTVQIFMPSIAQQHTYTLKPSLSSPHLSKCIVTHTHFHIQVHTHAHKNFLKSQTVPQLD